MRTSSNIPLPRTARPARDIFSAQGTRYAGSCFLKIAGRFSSFLEEMEASVRTEIYRDEIPMGRKVLYDMEHVETWFGDGEVHDADFQVTDPEFWRPPEGSWEVIYEEPLVYLVSARRERLGGHYRLSKNEAMDDARALSKAHNCKIAVCKVLELIDWH